MPLANKITVKQYENGAWPGTDVVLLEESGYLDLFVSADDGTTYKAHRVASQEEADKKAELFYALIEKYLCQNCGGCSCKLDICLMPTDSKCSCRS